MLSTLEEHLAQVSIKNTFLKKMFLIYFERERARTSKGGAEGERAQSPIQAPTHHPVDHDLNQN